MTMTYHPGEVVRIPIILVLAVDKVEDDSHYFPRQPQQLLVGSVVSLDHCPL